MLVYLVFGLVTAILSVMWIDHTDGLENYSNGGIGLIAVMSFIFWWAVVLCVCMLACTEFIGWSVRSIIGK